MDWLDNIGQGIDDDLKIPIAENEEQEWRIERLGKVTGSQLGKLVVKDRSTKGYKLSSGKVASDMLYKIAWERFLITESEGLNRLNVSSQAMQHGNDYELAAIKALEEVTGLKVKLGGYQFKKYNEFFGGTPDGYIDDDTIIEVKAPWNGGNHLKTLITKEIYNEDHFYQIQGYLLLTGAKKCIYATYDPDLPEGINIALVEVQRDEEIIKAIKEIIDECKSIIEDIISKVQEKKN